MESPCLFNIKEDPCEFINLAEKRPIILAALEETLLKYRVTAIPAANVPEDDRANPKLWGGVWVNWRDGNFLAANGSNNSTPRLSGSTIAVIAALLGLVFIAIVTLVAMKQAKKSDLQHQHRDSHHQADQQMLSTVNKEDEADSSKKIGTDIETLTKLNSIKNLAKGID